MGVYRGTSGHIQERSPTSVTTVDRGLVSVGIYRRTSGHIQETSETTGQRFSMCGNLKTNMKVYVPWTDT